MEFSFSSQKPFVCDAAIPVEVDAWVYENGTMLFDLPGGGFRLCASPARCIRGKFPDVAALELALAEGKTNELAGGLAGAVDYEGNYIFGFYPVFYDWDPCGRRWNREVPSNPKAVFPDSSQPISFQLSPSIPRELFLENVRNLHEWIASGDIYQACLTYPFCGKFSGDAWSLYKKFRQVSPAPHACFFRADDFLLLSASPELLLRMDGKNAVTRPIKGTRPSPQGGDDGGRTERELLSSAKERAELTMITDLERNDLGKICEFGSVCVDELLRVEKFAQVFHLVSTVRGKLREDISHPMALGECFPGGSITGAPKKRAMEILAEMEGEPRGFYTGTIGWFGFDGVSQFNIAIRTLEINGGEARYGTGAGIVADSDPESEWEETLVKSKGILDACRT